MKQLGYTPPTELKSVSVRALIVGVVFMVLLLIGSFIDRTQFFHAYLVGFVFWIGITLGSLALLGVTEHYWLELPDVDMQSPLPEVGAARVRNLMEKISPDTVLTFGPDGMTRHEGHKSVGRWASEAFQEVAPTGAKLYYATQTPEFAQEWLPKLEPFNIFLPGTPPTTPRVELSICFELDERGLERKVNAIQQHASQIEGLLLVFGEEGFRRFMAEEYYRLAQVKAPSGLLQ